VRSQGSSSNQKILKGKGREGKERKREKERGEREGRRHG
jgi:hypothetical protein